MAKTRPFVDGDGANLAIVLALGAAVLGYAGLRASRVSLTYDEATTFFNYVRQGFLGIFRVDLANNHVLNSLLTWLVTRVAGSSEFALRLPNLAGLLLYLVFSFRILKRYSPSVVAVSGFVLLNANPFVLEFFSLCRGYGLSLGLLMTALYFFFLFLDGTRESGLRASRALAMALVAAGAAVLANLTLLIIFLGLVFLAVAIIADHNARSRRDRAEFDQPLPRIRVHPVLAAGLSGFILLINGGNLFRDAYKSERLFTDVAVSVSGLAEEELESVLVIQKDIRGERSKMPLEADGWRFDRPRPVTGIQVGIPAKAWPKVTSLTVRIGSRPFVFSGARLRGLSTGLSQDLVVLTIPNNVSLQRSRFSPMNGCINGKGDGPYLVRLGERVLIVVGFFVILGLGLLVAGRIGARLRLVTRSQYRPLAIAVWTLAALTAVPIYVLKQSEELYWGGKVGFFHDTWFTLAQDSFYGKSYVRGQEYIVLLAAAGIVVLSVILTLIRRPDRRPPSSGPMFVLLALILFSSGFYYEQHALLGTPYLLGRTAVFFASLVVLLFILALATVRVRPRFKTAVTAACVVLAMAAGTHLILVANTSFAWEWKLDADNKILISDLHALQGKIKAADQPIVLAIRWEAYPALLYYVEEKHLPWLKLEVIPENENSDVYFLNEAFDEARMVLVKRYPLSGHILVTPK